MDRCSIVIVAGISRHELPYSALVCPISQRKGPVIPFASISLQPKAQPITRAKFAKAKFDQMEMQIFVSLLHAKLNNRLLISARQEQAEEHHP
ncbi:unnamed protein product [Citrullus colocynthis]|uniref:Uncharacterized protein n=1 Tax=Citrullus colocynthis TaxID=252529 RepID=A0ABP0Z8G3_9ROSI